MRAPLWPAVGSTLRRVCDVGVTKYATINPPPNLHVLVAAQFGQLIDKEHTVPLLVAAIDSELQAFPQQLVGWDRLITGPGKLLAAVRLAQFIARHPVDRVLVAGTAGGLTPSVTGGIFSVGTAMQHDTTDLNGIVGSHVALPRTITLADTGPTIATGDVFVDSADEVARIHSLGADLVDMESYAYAWVAQDAGIPINIVKCVSDPAQDGATQLWDDVVASCSKRLWDHLKPQFA